MRRHRKQGLVLLLGLLNWSALPVEAVTRTDAGEGPVEVVFTESSRGHLIVEVSVDGGPPVPFALDTAAGRTMIHEGRLEELGLRSVEAIGSPDVVQGAHGQHTLGWTRLESLEIGGVTLGEMDAGTMDLGHIEGDDMVLFGVLGADVLSRFDLELKLAERSVVFHRPAGSAEDCAVCLGEVGVPFDLVQGTHIQIELTIDETPIAAIVDTGSGRTGMNRRGAEALGLELPPVPPGAHAVALRISEVRLAGSTLARDLLVGVVDLPVFEALGLADQPAMILGTNALANRRVGISYALQCLSVD